MTRKYHNHKLQTKLRHREEEAHNNQETQSYYVIKASFAYEQPKCQNSIQRKHLKINWKGIDMFLAKYFRLQQLLWERNCWKPHLKTPIHSEVMPIWISDKKFFPKQTWKTKNRFNPTMHHSVMSYEVWNFSLNLNICKCKEVVKLMYAFLWNNENGSRINVFLNVTFHWIKNFML